MGKRIALLFAFIHLPSLIYAQKSLYVPCPILGPTFPVPTIDPSSAALQAAVSEFKATLENYTASGTGEYGPITPKITTFSLAFFAGSNYIASENATPYFFDYHYTTPNATSSENVSGQSTYPLGSLTQLLTVYLILIELGGSVWGMPITDFIPELAAVPHTLASLDQVQWGDVTLGSLAGQLSGIPFTSDACAANAPCSRTNFLSALTSQPALFQPDTTPIESYAALQLLASALETCPSTKGTFADILEDRIFQTLDLNSTSLLANSTAIFDIGLSNTHLTGEPAALGVVSSTTDLSTLGRSILTSRLISPAETRRWFKPVADTSNLRNSVGRSWEIYHSGNEAIDLITDVYTKSGSIGRYSSYFGIAPDFAVGFVLLAVNTEGSAPDLNAYADLASDLLGDIGKLSALQAMTNYAGQFGTNETGLTISLETKGNQTALTLTALIINGTDWRFEIAILADIDPENVDIRLYPSIPGSLDPKGDVQVFEAVIQDESALVDAGTPTCVSWQTVGQLERSSMPLNRFTFNLGSDGAATNVVNSALGISLQRA